MNDMTGVALFVYHTDAETKWSPFAEDIEEMHFSEWKCINFDRDFIEIVPNCPTNNFPSLVQIMAWRRPGDKPLSEPMLVCFTDAYMRHRGSMSYVTSS